MLWLTVEVYRMFFVISFVVELKESTEAVYGHVFPLPYYYYGGMQANGGIH